MKIQSINLPTIQETTTNWETSSQNARVEGYINTDKPLNLHAIRLERAMKIAQITPSIPQSNETAPQQTRAVKTWKNFCHSVSMFCGTLFFPSFACLAFGVIGLCVPAALLVVGVIFHCLGGKPTPETETARQERAAQNAAYDPR